MEISHPSKSDVLTAIREAFDGVDRGDGVRLHEADVMDGYGSDGQCAAARSFDTDLIWEDVPRKDIARFSTALYFLDPQGFRYYIPAYMDFSLDDLNEESASSTVFALVSLDEPEAFHANKLRLLNDAQRQAIALFLLYVTPDQYQGDRARAALQRFWEKYLPAEYRH